MSFTFNWPRFSDQFHYDAIQMLNTALNKGNKPPIIADKIEVVELEMGSQPPELEIRDIGDLTVDQFRGIFRLTYSGDAHLVLKTKVQANPLNHKQPDIHLMGGSRGMLAAKQPLVVPMLLRLSHFKLNSYVVLVVSKQKGITLVFKTDPLQNVDINSTFDSIAVIQKFIQREIEGQLRQMFREDLPGIIHRLSQQWVKAKVEAPYLEKRPPPVTRRTFHDTRSYPDTTSHVPSNAILTSHIGFQPSLTRQQSLRSLRSLRRPRSVSGSSVTSAGRHTTASTSALPRPKPTSPPVPSDPVSFPDLENFDPTYGLRPEGVPVKSFFRGFSSLFTPNKGLADLAEEPSELDSDDDGYASEGASFDMVNWDYTVPESGATPPQSIYNDNGRESNVTEYETIPAVGGGTITRPRIYHSQSLIQPTPGAFAASSKSSLPLLPTDYPLRHRPHSSYGSLVTPRSGFATPGLVSRSGGYFVDRPGAGPSSLFSAPQTAPAYGGFSRRSITPDSIETQPSQSSSGHLQSISTPPTDHLPHEDDDDEEPTSPGIYMRHPRRNSISSATSNNSLDTAFLSSSHRPQSPSHLNLHFPTHALDGTPKIILRNNSIHQLSTLSHSNHTLSPYTRSLEHFTVRSVPPRGVSGLATPLERQPVKARRKRMYHLGGRKTAVGAEAMEETAGERTQRKTPGDDSVANIAPPEFDVSDMDRYFRSHDDLASTPSPPPPPPPPGDTFISTGNIPSAASTASIRNRRLFTSPT